MKWALALALAAPALMPALAALSGPAPAPGKQGLHFPYGIYTAQLGWKGALADVPNDTPVIYEHEQITTQWNVQPNWLGVVRADGTNKCLEAGMNPTNGSKAKVWDCHGEPWQIWLYHHSYLELVHYGLCLSSNDIGDPLELWECKHGSTTPTNQWWWDHYES